MFLGAFLAFVNRSALKVLAGDGNRAAALVALAVGVFVYTISSGCFANRLAALFVGADDGDRVFLGAVCPHIGSGSCRMLAYHFFLFSSQNDDGQNAGTAGAFSTAGSAAGTCHGNAAVLTQLEVETVLHQVLTTHGQRTIFRDHHVINVVGSAVEGIAACHTVRAGDGIILIIRASEAALHGLRVVDAAHLANGRDQAGDVNADGFAGGKFFALGFIRQIFDPDIHLQRADHLISGLAISVGDTDDVVALNNGGSVSTVGFCEGGPGGALVIRHFYLLDTAGSRGSQCQRAGFFGNIVGIDFRVPLSGESLSVTGDVEGHIGGSIAVGLHNNQTSGIGVGSVVGIVGHLSVRTAPAAGFVAVNNVDSIEGHFHKGGTAAVGGKTLPVIAVGRAQIGNGYHIITGD